MKHEKYKTIVIDPPWPGPEQTRSVKGGECTVLPYQTMTGIQTAALRIHDIADDGCKLWVWCTSRSITDAGLLVQLWGFRYGGLFIWKKRGRGLGCRIAHDSEFLLHAVMPGARFTLPAPVQTHEWPKPRRHSEKPAEAYAMIAELSDEPRIDIFARQARPGFEPWGNEAPTELAPQAAAVPGVQGAAGLLPGARG